MKNKTILITGVAGFIGSYLCKKIASENSGAKIIGVDNLNDYYDVSLKKERLKDIESFKNFLFFKGDISDETFINDIFKKYKPQIVVNLAAQAGVRYSITNPRAYITANVIGFFNILEACRHNSVEHLVYASSSSVYGSNKKVPYSTADKVDNPVSLYAATKKSNELMAHSYSKLYGLPTTGLRFFTVYGPMGRPDMAYFSFTQKMVAASSIQVFNNGDMYRDFTYIDDIIEGVYKVMHKTPAPNEENVKYKVYNIGNNKPEKLMYFIETLENALIKHELIASACKKEFLPMQQGDVYQTYADVDELVRDFNFKPNTPLKHGLEQFAIWYKKYYNI